MVVFSVLKKAFLKRIKKAQLLDFNIPFTDTDPSECKYLKLKYVYTALFTQGITEDVSLIVEEMPDAMLNNQRPPPPPPLNTECSTFTHIITHI